MSGDLGGSRRPPTGKGGASSQPVFALGKKPHVPSAAPTAAAMATQPSRSGLFSNTDAVQPSSGVSAARKALFSTGPSQPVSSTVAKSHLSQKDSLKSKIHAGARTSQPVSSAAAALHRAPAFRQDQAHRPDHSDWHRQAQDTDGKSLATVSRQVVSGECSMSDEKLCALICGAIRQLHQNRHKDVDELMLLSLSRLATVRPELFRNNTVLTALMSLIKRDPVYNSSMGYKSKSTIINCMIGASLLYTVLQDIPRWPAAVMKLYLEDAAFDRQWVDLAETKEFVRAIRFSFGTKAPSLATPAVAEVAETSQPKPGQSPRHLQPEDAERLGRASPSLLTNRAPSPSFSTGTGDDSMSDSNLSASGSIVKDAPSVRTDRFADLRADIPQMIMEVTNAFRGTDGGKNMIRLLISTAGVAVTRQYAMQRIDGWMTNSKTASAAMSLMATVCANCTVSSNTDEDLNVISMFLKTRCKGKPAIDNYLLCLHELLERNSDNLQVVLKMIFETELADAAINKRTPWTMIVMAATMRYKPLESAVIAGNLFATLIVNPVEDYTRHLKVIMHELVKTYKTDVRQEKFIMSMLTGKALSNQTMLTQLRLEDQGNRDKKLLALLDIVLAAEVLMLLTRFKEDLASGNSDAFVTALAPLQSITVEFVKTTAKKWFGPTNDTIRVALRKIFLLDKPNTFQVMDKWPTEHERNTFFKWAARVPVTAHTITQIQLLMASCEPLTCLEMLETVLVRALGLRAENYEAIRIGELIQSGIIESLFQLGIYRVPENAVFPPKYRVPQLIRRDIFWQCWKIILLLGSADPAHFGKFIWERFPTARALMQMLIISRYEFPPETMTTPEKTSRFFLDREQKLAEDEKKVIVELENRLAGGNAKNIIVSDVNAKLPKDYTRYDISGPLRCPPESFLGALEKLNKQLELGKLLSGCRDPDFLIEILSEKGTAASLPWLLELTTSAKSMFDVLPVECVCEMLSNSLLKKPMGAADKRDQDFRKCCNLALRLSDSIIGANVDYSNATKTVNFFSDRLASETALERDNAKVALEIFFDPDKIESALANLWGLSDSETVSEGSSERIIPEPRVRQGISIEAALMKVSPDAWCPPSVTMPKETRMSYMEKFKWLLTDIPARSTDFEMLRNDLCLHLAKAIEVECDTESICAYLEFISCYAQYPPAERIKDYIVMQVVADLLVNRRDLRDAVLLLGTGALTEAECHRVQDHLVKYFEIFLGMAYDDFPEKFASFVDNGLFLNDPLLRIHYGAGENRRTYCLTSKTGRALPTLLALVGDTESRGNEVLLPFCLNSNLIHSAVTWMTREPAEIMTDAVREVIFQFSRVNALVDMALADVSDETLIRQICRENIPLDNLRRMVSAVNIKNHTTLASLKHFVRQHVLTSTATLECRLAQGLTLDDPVHALIHSTLTTARNPFAVPFTF
ncbi:integrator complex subunit 1-like isoform X2 [Paramacrobiotus metropolitanus]|uniref:integrator complex subunit 1-like isoform X2 n=1 Tax=Paramacrobiotus metropolitanus TaxID=2943436 RepID=UPI0024461EDE|nr:integrator complex subunit 1-like isoform X2 [Paramacrobiotus metropolitanus]